MPIFAKEAVISWELRVQQRALCIVTAQQCCGGQGRHEWPCMSLVVGGTWLFDEPVNALRNTLTVMASSAATP